jgi:hypothetical protein
MRKTAILSAMLLLFFGCRNSGDNNEAARSTALQWATAYFNYDFHEAADYCTPESERWLRFAASNATSHDLELLQGRQAAAEVEQLLVTGDTSAVAIVRVSDYVVPATFSQPSSIVEEDGIFRIPLVRHNGNWRVRMEGLPRSERQSRD